MPYIRSLLTTVTMLCLLACSRTSSLPWTMLRAECVMNSAPDSAMVLLAGFKDSVLTESETTRMYYQLLTVKASDKCYVPHTSDSLMKAVVSYYERHGTPRQLMEAYYYLGSVYRDMRDAPQALEYYQKAMDMSKNGKEYDVLGQIYSQIGMLYMYQKAYNEAFPVLKQAYSFCLLTNDSLSLPYALRDIGRAFTAQHNADSTLYYYEASYQAAKRINNSECMSVIQGELASIYIQLKRYEQARTALIQSSVALRGNGSMALHYASWGDLYKEMGQLDSAFYYYHKALGIGNVYVKKSACLDLYQIKRASTRDKGVFQYMDQYLIYQDSVQRITDTESIKKVEMIYNYQHIENENNRLILTNEKSKVALYQLVFAIIMLLFISIVVIYRQRRAKQQLIEQERRLHFFEEARYKESMGQIEYNKEQIVSLERQLVIVREQNDLAKEELLTIRKNSLEEKNSSIASSCLEREALITLFHHSAIYLLIVGSCKDPNFKMKEPHWIELQKEIDTTYNDFTNRLYALYPKLSVVELHVCYLIKVSISPSDIAALVCLKNNSISSIRKRLYEKIHGVPGTSSLMDSFLIDF